MSGSGKSSLVFDTVAAESQRLINETYSAFVQSFLPHYGRPDVDSVENLSGAIVVDQARMGSNARSKELADLQPHSRTAIERITTSGPCPECGGTR